MKKTIICVAFAIVLSAILTYALPNTSNAAKLELEENIKQTKEDDVIIKQAMIGTSETAHDIYTIYLKEKRIGILQDYSKLEKLLDKVHDERYQDNFPDSKLGLGEDIHVQKELTFINYEDKDDEIIKCLDRNDLFSVEVNKIEFSNGAVTYVKNVDDFIDAREDFALNFISKSSYDILKNKQKTPELVNYGTRDVSFEFLDDAKISKGLAPESKILKDKNEANYYLTYGYDTAIEYYEVKEFDTVEGVAWQHGISVKRLMSINAETLKSETQLLTAGMKLNVSELNSPIDIKVVKENLKKETVYPDASEQILDASLPEGQTIVVQEELLGYKNVKYEEVYINGELKSGEAISSMVIEEPQKEIVRVGTYVEPSVGNGNFRYPVNNPIVTCRVGCYYGHNGTDIQDSYNNWGPVLASDRGVVINNSYDSMGGYHITIDHGNGFTTYYGHMSGPGFFYPGAVVGKGQQIGNIGDTGYAFGAHVHFEVRYNGRVMDGCDYLGC
ncbi:MAG: peptidoglycan DD-metalloendopeptidase family protein [Erysipelotrichaceae bacterium]